MIKMEKGTMKSCTGQLLDTRLWLPEVTPCGIVQMVHGMAEHIDRYDAPARALAARGWIVVGETHLGHGPRAKIRGYFGPEHGWDNLLSDIHSLRLQTQQRFPGLPYVILGHSMGSFLTRCYLTEHADGLHAAVLSGTGYFAPGLLGFALAVAAPCCLLGADKPSPLINAIMSSGNNRAFQPVRTASDWLSRDKKQVDRFVADPYCGFMFTACGYRDMFRGLSRLNDTARLQKMPKDLPVYFFSGEADPVGSAGKGVRTVYDQFVQLGMKQVTLKLYPEGRHEMFNELNAEEVYADLNAWLAGTL